MTINKPTPTLFSLKFGLAFGVIYIIYQVIRKMLGIHYINTGFNQLFLVSIFISLVVLNIAQFRKSNQGQLSFLQAMQSGISISIFASFFVILYMVFLTTVIEPDYYTAYSEANRDRHMLGNPHLTEEQIEADIAAGLASLPGEIQKTFFFYLIGGLLISLPTGLVLRRSD